MSRTFKKNKVNGKIKKKEDKKLYNKDIRNRLKRNLEVTIENSQFKKYYNKKDYRFDEKKELWDSKKTILKELNEEIIELEEYIKELDDRISSFKILKFPTLKEINLVFTTLMANQLTDEYSKIDWLYNYYNEILLEKKSFGFNLENFQIFVLKTIERHNNYIKFLTKLKNKNQHKLNKLKKDIFYKQRKKFKK